MSLTGNARSQSRRAFLRLAAIGSIGSLIAACSPSMPNTPAAAPRAATAPAVTPAPKPAAAPNASLNVALPTLGTEVWLPRKASLETNVLYLVGETLIRTDPKTRALRPNLAESWSVSNDSKTWTFKLRAGVPFHDSYGTVTAEDVRFTWAEFLKTDATHPRTAAYRAAVGNDMANFEVVSPTEFRVRAESPQVDLPVNLADGGIAMTIQSRKYWEAVGEPQAVARPIGTGPFRFVSHQRGKQVNLAAVPNHWRQPPQVAAVSVKVVPDAATMLAQIQTGELDLTPLSLRLKPEALAARVKLTSVPSAANVWVNLGGMYPDTPQYDRLSPWIQADSPEMGRKIREAMTVAIDHQAILSRIAQGEGQLSTAPYSYIPGPYPFINPDWKVPPYDPSAARRLLAEGGYPNGFPVEMPVFQTVDPTDRDFAEAVAGMWEVIGLKVKRSPMDYQPTMREKLVKRETTGMAYIFSSYFYDEPLPYFVTAFMPQSAVAHIHDRNIAESVAKMQAQPDMDKRMALARGIGDYIVAERLAIPMNSVNSLWMTSSRIGAWSPQAGVRLLSNVESIVIT